jgi:hypothetical protein
MVGFLMVILSLISCKKKNDTVALQLSASPSEIVLPAGGGTENLAIEGNANWTISNGASWLQLNKTSGSSGSNTVQLTAGSNETGSTRSIIMSVNSSNGQSRRVTVSQPVKKEENAPDSSFHIYLAFGQSNMDGAGTIESQDKVGIDERFKVMGAVNCTGDRIHQLGKWTTATPPLVRCGTGLGISDYFGRTLVQELPSGIKIGIVPVAVSGCDIALFDKVNYASYAASAPSWMRDIINSYGGNPYARLVEVAKLAQKQGVIKGIIFHQGETNTNNPEWKNKVAEVVKNLKADLQLGDVPFLAGELLASAGACCSSHNVEVNKLPSLISNAHIISSAGLEGADGAHFTSASYREFGKRYAKKMIELIK